MGKNKNGLKKYDNVGYFFVLPFVETVSSFV